MATDAPLLDQQVCFQLYTASRLMTRVYKPILSRLSLTYPQYLVMLVLWEWADEGPQVRSVTALGKRLYLDSGTLTPLLRRLEEKGLVKRTRSRADERVVHVTLTESGRRLSAEASGIPGALLCDFDGDVSELIALREQLRGLVHVLAGA